MTMPAQKPGTSRQDFGTPAAFIEAVERRFGDLAWDLAAHAENTKCGDRYFGPGSTHHVDALRVNWSGYIEQNVPLWLNPEFGNIEPWAEKCALESSRRHGLILMLTPASVGAGWFQRHVHGKAFVLALAPRLSFDGKAPFPKDCSLAVYGYGFHGFDTWRWNEVPGVSGRIRSIKPELLEDAVTAGLSDTAFRLFIAAILLADDYGNLRAEGALLRGQVFWARDPATAFDGALDELAASRLVTFYRVRGQRYAAIRTWNKNQRVQKRGTARVPGIEAGHLEEIPESVRNPSGVSPETPRPDLRSPISITDHRSTNTPEKSAAPAAPGSSEPDVSDPEQGHAAIPVDSTDEGSPAAPPPADEIRASASDTKSSTTTPPAYRLEAPLPKEPRSRPAKLAETEVLEVFEHWLAGWRGAIGAGREPTPNEKRTGKIRARLREGFTAADLKHAIDGCWSSAWNIENHHYDIDLVCRDEAHVQRYLAKHREAFPAAARFVTLPPRESDDLDDVPTDGDDDPLADLFASDLNQPAVRTPRHEPTHPEGHAE